MEHLSLNLDKVHCKDWEEKVYAKKECTCRSGCCAKGCCCAKRECTCRSECCAK